MKFNNLNVPDHWQNYWTRYPEGYTILEALISWVNQVDDMVVNQNTLNENVEQFRTEIDDFVEGFEGRLQDEVIKTLSDWQASGFLYVVIDEALDTKYHEMDNRLSAQLAQANTQLNNINFDIKADFGAIGDNNTDDTQAIKNAISQVAAIATDFERPTLLFPYSRGYKVTETIVIPKNINVIMEAPVIYHGTLSNPCLVVGDVSYSNMRVRLKLKAQRQTQSEWLSENSIGIQVINANNSMIEISEARNFTIGCQFLGHNGGVAYNTVFLDYLYNNKIHMDLNNDNTIGIGWCNENLFINGRFGINSGVHPTLPRYGVRITSKQNYYNNNNKFIKPCFELTKGETVEAIPVLMEYGNYNSFEKIRNEWNSEITMRVGNQSRDNHIDSGFGLANVEDNSQYPTNMGTSLNGIALQMAKNNIFNADKLHKKACFSNGATSVSIPDITTVYSHSNLTFLENSGVTIHPDYLEVATTSGVGIFLNTKYKKRFVVKKDVEEAYGGRLAIRCYNSAGDILTSVGEKHPYVKGTAANQFTYNSSFGGVYRTGVDSTIDTFFSVGDDVAYVCVLITGVSNPLRIRKFSIFTPDEGDCATWTGYDHFPQGVNLGTSAPTGGTWEKGKFVSNRLKAEVGNTGTKYIVEGWECITAGTPGTWVEKRSLTGN